MLEYANLRDVRPGDFEFLGRPLEQPHLERAGCRDGRERALRQRKWKRFENFAAVGLIEDYLIERGSIEKALRGGWFWIGRETAIDRDEYGDQQ